MKVNLTFILVFICCVTCSGQKPASRAKDDARQMTVKKQIVVDNLESRIKDVSFAAVRVFVRFKTAAWLWDKGADRTNRAEPLAVKALEELYEKRDEIPEIYFNKLSSDIFVLLETNAKETARRLSAKYNLDSEDELKNANALLDKKDGEKLAADKIRKSLASQTELSPMTVWLMEELRSRKSPELLRILTEIIILEESGKSDFSAETLFFTADFFRTEFVPAQLRLSFYKIVLGKTRRATQSPDSDVVSAYDLITAVARDISADAPNLLPEANALQTALAAIVPRSITEQQRIYERIEDSSDRLSALISEAENTEDKQLKDNLLTEAAQLALKKGKIRLAVDLAEKTSLDKDEDKIFSRWYNQFLSAAARNALKKDDADAARHAAKKITDKLTLAEVLRDTALYFFEKRDTFSADDALGKSLKLAFDADDDTKKINCLIRLISATQKIDKNRISELSEKIARAINALPNPEIEDKPQTENYKKYVASIMAIDFNLMPAISQIAKENKSEAANFAELVNKREVKIIGDYFLSTAALDAEIEASKKDGF